MLSAYFVVAMVQILSKNPSYLQPGFLFNKPKISDNNSAVPLFNRFEMDYFVH